MKAFSRKSNHLKVFFILAFGIILFSLPAFAARNSIAVSAQWYYRAGLALYQKAYYEDALEKFEQALDEHFEYWESYQMIGNCYYNMRDKEKALVAFEQSLQINPANPQLVRFYKRLKSGQVIVPLVPVEYNLQPVGTPVVLSSLTKSTR